VEIILNGSPVTLESGMNVSQFLIAKSLHPETVIVEYNGEILKKNKYIQVVLQDKDCLEIMNFVGGG